ncbi:TPA: DUF262 domain-containing protein [Clostridium botulinum]|nr:DUF262 domain-containing protein [Clostridium botulinum]
MVTKRSKKIQVIQEETYEQYRERRLKEIYRGFKFLNKPTYTFNIGDVVIVGVFENPVVFEILENGKIYGIEYTHKGKLQRNWFIWPSVRRVVDKQGIEFAKRDNTFLQYFQTGIFSLLNKIYHIGVDFNPSYQRELVWSIEDKEKLIDSIFNSIDIGKFVFVFKGYDSDEMYEILDGKQRLSTIREYYEDQFPYKGKYFSDLSIRDKDHFIDYKINVAETEEITEERKLRYFIKLNTTGKVMDKAHLNKVIEQYNKLTNQG